MSPRLKSYTPKAYNERAFELGAMGREELLSILTNLKVPLYVTTWPTKDLRSEILAKEFPDE